MLKVNFVEQFSFEECRDKKKLLFDFAILDNNKVELLIEFDGKYHYELARFKIDNKSKLLSQIKRDKIKDEFCKTHNIKLLRIPYWEFNKIESIITDTLKSAFFIADANTEVIAN